MLLDSHTLLWWLEGLPRLPVTVRAMLGDDENDAFVSAVSVWEICTKHRIGKLPEAAALASSFTETILAKGFSILPITLPHAERAGKMRGDHKDPFDRMLMAQALIENLTLVSNEKAFDAFGVSRLW